MNKNQSKPEATKPISDNHWKVLQRPKAKIGKNHNFPLMTENNVYDDIWSSKDPKLVESDIEKALKLDFFSVHFFEGPGVAYDGEYWENEDEESWEKFIRHGHGKLYYKETDFVLYEGLFLCGGIHGQFVKIYRENGMLEYQGEVVCGKKIEGTDYHHDGKRVQYQGKYMQN